MSVAKGSDDVWVGVKCQTNLEIAGSPRNAFRCSPEMNTTGGRALAWLGGSPLTEPYQTVNTSGDASE